jgi:peroxiredoxin
MSLARRLLDRVGPPLLSVGSAAPSFALQSWDGSWHRAEDGPHVLVLYPADKTPGCTQQLQAFEAELSAFEAAGVRVLGLNPAELASHQAFAEAAGLTFPLLHDPGGALVRRLHSAWPTGLGTRVIRTVYGVDATGTVRFAQRGAPAPAAVRAALAG